MGFIVEDGSGLINSNSYISVEYADDYFASRDVISWVGSLVAKQGAIVQATDYIERRWGKYFNGIAQYASKPQALSFPRTGVYDYNGMPVIGIPEKLKKATAEYAFRAYSADLSPDPKFLEDSVVVSKKTEKIGPIEETTEYEIVTTSPVIIRPYPAADQWLTEYVSSTGLNYR